MHDIVLRNLKLYMSLAIDEYEHTPAHIYYCTVCTSYIGLHDCCKVDAEKSLHDFKNIFHYQLPLTWQDLDTRFTDLKNKNGSAVTLLYRCLSSQSNSSKLTLCFHYYTYAVAVYFKI